MSNAEPATKLPWSVGESSYDGMDDEIVDSSGVVVAHVYESRDTRIILEACNSYPELQAKLAELKYDQGQWRKGVELIASAAAHDTSIALCCVSIAETVLGLRAEAESVATLTAEVARLKGLLQKWYDERGDHYDIDSCCLHLETAEALGEDAEA